MTKMAKIDNAYRWNEQQRLFQLWLALPEDEREHKSQQDFAKALGVHPVTVSEWKRLPGFMDAVNNEAYQQLRDSLHEAFKTIKRRALSSEKIEWMNLYLSLMGGATVVAGANATMNMQNTMTDDEAEEIMNRALGVKMSAVVVTTPPAKGDGTKSVNPEERT